MGWGCKTNEMLWVGVIMYEIQNDKSTLPIIRTSVMENRDKLTSEGVKKVRLSVSRIRQDCIRVTWQNVLYMKISTFQGYAILKMNFEFPTLLIIYNSVCKIRCPCVGSSLKAVFIKFFVMHIYIYTCVWVKSKWMWKYFLWFNSPGFKLLWMLRSFSAYSCFQLFEPYTPTAQTFCLRRAANQRGRCPRSLVSDNEWTKGLLRGQV